MADAKIVAVGPGEVELITNLYNEVFSPSEDEEFFRRRFLGRHNMCLFVAMLSEHHVGFATGYELRPTTYYCWLCGVLPDARRMGVATQLMHAQQAFAVDNGYSFIRFECQNQHRPMLHFAIREGYDLVGIRWETASAANMVVFEKDLR